jgi:hypothetical protein
MDFTIKIDVVKHTNDKKEYNKFMKLKDKHSKLKNKIKQKKMNWSY